MPVERRGPYRIERQLGRGGMGAVYAAQHVDTGARVAVKALAAALGDDENFRLRFAGEIDSMIKFRHPHIVEIYAYGEDEHGLYYAMELVNGRSLHDELQAGRRFTWLETCRLGMDICKALKHAHDHGVIHRDLKPANLLLNESGQVKLTDFGIAKFFGNTQLTNEGGVLGTADYMAPEQAEGKPVSQRSDLYSLGGVLFALLTGRPPFVGKSLPEVLHMLRYSEPPSVRRLIPEVPEELDILITELLSKEPQQRIPTAVAVGRRLEAMVRALTAPSKPAAEGDADKPAASDEFVIEQNATKLDVRPQQTRKTPDQTLEASAEELRLQPDEPAQPPPPRTALDEERATALTGAPPGEVVVPVVPARQSRFKVVDEEERRRASYLEPDVDHGPAWPKIASIVVILAVLASLLWYALQPPSADQMYARLQRAASSDDASELAAAEDDIERFLELFPADERRAELTSLLEEIQLNRLKRRFERQAQRAGAAESLLPAERAYLEAIATLQANPELGLAKLQAVVDVFAGYPDPSENTGKCVELAKRQVKQLRASFEKAAAQQVEMLNAQLARALELAATSPEESAALLRGLQTLYHDKPWAAEPLERVRASLANSPAVKGP